MAKRRSTRSRLDPKSLPPVAVIYCRVSSVEQADNFSIPRQERECRTYNDRRGLTTDRVFVDPGESATTIERPMFQEMLAYLRKNRGRIGYVVVWNASRFSRNALDFALTSLEAAHRLQSRTSIGD
jgi:site-specific DNA recombinase